MLFSSLFHLPVNITLSEPLQNVLMLFPHCSRQASTKHNTDIFWKPGLPSQLEAFLLTACSGSLVQEMLANVWCWDLRALREALELACICVCWVSTTSQAWRCSVGIMVIICRFPVARAGFTPLQFTAIIFSHNHNSICGVGALTIPLHRNPALQKSHFTLSHCFPGWNSSWLLQLLLFLFYILLCLIFHNLQEKN